MTTPTTDEELAALREHRCCLVPQGLPYSIVEGLIARLDAAEERVRELEARLGVESRSAQSRGSVAEELARRVVPNPSVPPGMVVAIADVRRDALLEAAEMVTETIGTWSNTIGPHAAAEQCAEQLRRKAGEEAK